MEREPGGPRGLTQRREDGRRAGWRGSRLGSLGEACAGCGPVAVSHQTVPDVSAKNLFSNTLEHLHWTLLHLLVTDGNKLSPVWDAFRLFVWVANNPDLLLHNHMEFEDSVLAPQSCVLCNTVSTTLSKVLWPSLAIISSFLYYVFSCSFLSCQEQLKSSIFLLGCLWLQLSFFKRSFIKLQYCFYENIF